MVAEAKNETAPRERFFVGDLTDNAFMAKVMSGAEYVLYVPTIPRAFDCEVAPAENTITFLETVTGAIHNVMDCRVKKLVIAGFARPEPLYDMPALLAALMETVVVAEARYLGPDSAITVCYARQREGSASLIPLADYAFANATNGDLVIQKAEGIERKPCESFEMRR